jgi:uncharacterized protein
MGLDYSCMKQLQRALLIIAGTLSVVLGAIGIFLPMLPTTPFLLLAAVCFARSSPRMLHWLTHNRWFGSYIRNYREGRGMPRLEKYLTIAALWLTIGITILFFTTVLWVELTLAAIALAVTIHLLRIKTFDSDVKTAHPAPMQDPNKF